MMLFSPIYQLSIAAATSAQKIEHLRVYKCMELKFKMEIMRFILKDALA